MTIGVILSSKGSDVETVAPEATLRDVADTLSRLGIGAVVVSDRTRALLGVISERDVVRAVARHGADALAKPVSDHMTRRVVTASMDMTVGEAMSRMTEGRFRHMPVVEGGRLEGIVSIGDLVKFRLSEMEHDHKAMLDYITTS